VDSPSLQAADVHHPVRHVHMGQLQAARLRHPQAVAERQQQQQVARERTAEKKRQRSDETRRKILVGAVILAKVERGEWTKERLRELMDQALTRADDRVLFGLPTLSEEGPVKK